MARLKRNSAALDKAVRRYARLRSISSTLSFGEGLALADYDARIQALQAQLANYNTTVTQLDEIGSTITRLERELNRHSDQMLMGVGTLYGRNSLQYVQAGGGSRRRSFRKDEDATDPTPIAEPTSTNGRTAPVS